MHKDVPVPTHLPEFSNLTDAVASTRLAGGRFGGTTTRFIGNTNSLEAERSQFRGGLSQTIARLNEGQAGNSFASTLGGTLRQAKARQGIVNRGEKSIRSQQLRDRISIARLGINKRQRGIDSLGNAANIREGVNLANADADRSIARSDAGLFGGIAGGAAAFFKGRRNNTKPKVGSGIISTGAPI